MKRPEDYEYHGPMAATRCSIIVNGLLNPDLFGAVILQACRNLKVLVVEQIALVDTLVKSIKFPTVKKVLIPKLDDVQDPSSALSAYDAEVQYVDVPEPLPWDSVSSGHARISHLADAAQFKKMLLCANIQMLEPARLYCCDSGTEFYLKAFLRLIQMDWSEEAHFLPKYVGEISPVAGKGVGVLDVKTGPYPIKADTSYSVTIDGVSSPWSPASASAPVLVGTKNNVVITDGTKSKLTFDIGALMYSTVRYTGAFLVLAPPYLHTLWTNGALIANEGDYVHNAVEGHWSKIASVNGKYLLCPDYDGGSTFTGSVHVDRKITILINGNSYTAESPYGASVTVSFLVSTLSEAFPSTGPNAVTVTSSGTSIEIKQVSNAAGTKMEWSFHSSSERLYAILGITDTGISYGSVNNSLTTLYTQDGAKYLSLDAGTYSPSDVADKINELGEGISASVDAEGRLNVTAEDYGDWAYLATRENPLLLPEVAWGTSVPVEDTEELDFEFGESELSEIIKRDFSGGSSYSYDTADLTVDHAVKIREVGEKKWRVYSIASLTADTVVLNRSPCWSAKNNWPTFDDCAFEIQHKKAVGTVRPIVPDSHGDIEVNLIEGVDYLGLDASSSPAYFTKFSAVTTPVGRSPVRPGDWLFLMPVDFGAYKFPSWDACKYGQPFRAALNYDALQPYPSGWVPGDGDPSYEDLVYLYESGAPIMLMTQIIEVSSSYFTVRDGVPVQLLESLDSRKMFGGILPVYTPCVMGLEEYLSSVPFGDEPTMMGRGETLRFLEAYRVRLQAFSDYPVHAFDLKMRSAILEYCTAHNQTELVDALNASKLNRLFMANSGDSAGYAADALYTPDETVIFGFTGGDDSVEDAETLSPNTDTVQSGSDDEAGY